MNRLSLLAVAAVLLAAPLRSASGADVLGDAPLTPPRAAPAGAQGTLDQAQTRIDEAVAAARSEFDTEVSRLLDALRTGNRSGRIEALAGLKARFDQASYLDRHRIVDGLIHASDDRSDMSVRPLTIRALGEVGGRADPALATRVALHLADRLRASRLPDPFEDGRTREDLLWAYARAGAAAQDFAAEHHKVFIAEALTTIRENAAMTGGPARRAAAQSLFDFLMATHLVHSLYEYDVLEDIGRELVEIHRSNAWAFAPRGTNGQGRDDDAEFRFATARLVLYLYAPSGRYHTVRDPGLRTRLKDMIDRMYRDETNRGLKRFIGVHMGYERLFP